MEFVSAVGGTIIGYATLKFTSHPNSTFRNKLPELKLKWFQFCPTIKVFIFGRTIHFHHWLNLAAILLISIFVTGGILGLLITKGFLVGGILQGLSLPQATRFIYKDTL